MNKKQIAIKMAATDFYNGEPINSVMKKYNVCYSSVYNGLKKYFKDYNYTYGRKIFFNENIFENIDSEEKAYWLGFLYADGSVVKTDKKTYNRVQCSLSIKDKEHLIKFANFIKYPINKMFEYTPPNSYSSSTMFCIQCNSIKMSNDLIRHGCIPNKTLNCYIPNIKDDLIRHFIRGYFDGDGSISVKMKPHVTASVNFTSCDSFLLELRNYLSLNGFNNNKVIKLKNKNASSLSYGGKIQVSNFFNYIYKDCSVYMERKYNKFLPLLS